MKIAADIAQELLDRIDADAQFFTWTKLRSFRPVAKLEELGPGSGDAHRLTIVPRGVEITRLTRDTKQLETTIDLAIQDEIRLGTNELSDFDGVLEGVDKIVDFLHQKTNAVFFEDNEGESHFDSAAVTLMEVREVDETRVATAVVTATYLTARED
jgi:hypothetical protein